MMIPEARRPLPLDRRNPLTRAPGRSTVPRPVIPPTLADYAELLQPPAGSEVTALVLITPDDTGVDLSFWDVPPRVGHPSRALLGFRTEPQVEAIGLLTTGRSFRVGVSDPMGSPGHAALGSPVSITVLVGRDGSAATRLWTGEEPVTTIEDPPEGWMADVLSRCLGLPTPPPHLHLVDAVEAMWLHEIAVVTLDRPPGSPPTWEDLAHRHPLAPPGGPLPPELLAHETESFAATSSWSRLRTLYAGHLVPPDNHLRAPGRKIDLVDWFDDGTFARWFERQVVPSAELVADALDLVPEHLRRLIGRALVGDPEPVGPCPRRRG